MTDDDRTRGDSGRPSPYLVAVSQDSRSAHKHFADSAARNTGPILAVLRDVVPAAGRALEMASGTGQHVAAFAAAFPEIHWQPSDPTGAARTSVDAWVADSGLANVAPALALDATDGHWEAAIEPGLALIVCINMIHIAPWAACEGLLRGAGHLLQPDGRLYLYGPYKRDGVHTAPSNEEFDRSLRARHPEWGVRDLTAVAAAAATHGLALERTVEMPANNLSVLFQRTRV